MSLYQVRHDGEDYWVEADCIVNAVTVWLAHLPVGAGQDIEDPESVTLVHDGPVLRPSPESDDPDDDAIEDLPHVKCSKCGREFPHDDVLNGLCRRCGTASTLSMPRKAAKR